MKDKKEYNEEIGEIEDVTKYGEFISSFFAWNTLDGQKEIARRLENITNNKKQRKNE